MGMKIIAKNDNGVSVTAVSTNQKYFIAYDANGEPSPSYGRINIGQVVSSARATVVTETSRSRMVDEAKAVSLGLSYSDFEEE